MTASILMGGCGLADAEALFTDPKELDAEARVNPLFWEAALPVAGANGLYALDNDLFLNKPYNDLYRMGDDILLVGQATYGNDTQFKYSFDIYSPWRDKVIYSLHHNDITCDHYQVVGDELFLFDSTSNSITIYDASLKKVQTCDMSAALSQMKEFYMNDLRFYPTGLDARYYVEQDDGIFLVEMGKNCQVLPLPFTYYETKIVSSNPEEARTLFRGLDPVTLQNRFALLDNLTGQVLATYQGSWTGDAKNGYYIGCCDTTEHYWNYVTPSDSLYFQCDINQNVTLAPDGSIIFTDYNHSEDGDLYYLRGVEKTRIGEDGQILSYTNSEAATGGLVDDTYLSNHSARFYEEMIDFTLVYTKGEQPYLLIWDMNVDSTEKEDFAFYQSEEALFLHTEHTDWSEYYKENYGIEHFGSEISNIADPDTYDWGWLARANNRATELEEKYGVSIYLGPEIPDYLNVYAVSRTTNADRLMSALDALDDALSCYPDGFLPQLAVGRNKGLRIYLVGSIRTDDTTALESASGFATELNDYKVMVLDINYAYDWNYTVAHELSHMIDTRLELRASYDEDALYSEDAWMDLHPSGFHYLDSYQDYIGNSKYENYEDYFLDEYSLTFATEDRAVIFGTAVKDYLSDKDTDDSFAPGTPVANKYIYFCQCIRDGFDTKDWPETTSWELFLTQ